MPHMRESTNHATRMYVNQSGRARALQQMLKTISLAPHVSLCAILTRQRSLRLLHAQGWTNRTLAVHERVDCRFLDLPSSRSTITEITEYTYF